MDRVGARNTLIVLLTLVVLTLAVWGVLLALWIQEKNPDGNLLAAGTTLLGLVTGSAVTLGAQPKVPQRNLVVNQAIGTSDPDPDEELDELGAQVGDVDTEQISHQLAHSPANGPDEPPAADDPQPQPPAGEY